MFVTFPFKVLPTVDQYQADRGPEHLCQAEKGPEHPVIVPAVYTALLSGGENGYRS